MQQVEFPELLNYAKAFSEKGDMWHHHFFPLACEFGQDDKYQIFLENETTKESYVTFFDERPMHELEQMENVFFKRV
jgi:hypothetical protein